MQGFPWGGASAAGRAFPVCYSALFFSAHQRQGTFTTVPRSGSKVTSKEPFSSSARSRIDESPMPSVTATEFSKPGAVVPEEDGDLPR